MTLPIGRLPRVVPGRILARVVSDYHYRELWYKAEENIPGTHTRFFINFHAPIPIQKG